MNWLKKNRYELLYNFLWIGAMVALVFLPAIPIGWIDLTGTTLVIVFLSYVVWTKKRYL